MPFTPFHFGAGYLASLMEKKPKYFCFAAFVLSQVVIDTETLVNIVNRAPRLHTFFHSFLGSLVAAFIALLLSYPLIKMGLLLLRGCPEGLGRWLDNRGFFPLEMPSLKALVVSVVFGGWSHVVLDSVMHPDMVPFYPWSQVNPFLELISLQSLHLLCLLLFGLGYGIVVFRNEKQKV